MPRTLNNQTVLTAAQYALELAVCAVDEWTFTQNAIVHQDLFEEIF